MQHPSLSDYVELFRLYGDNLGSAYLHAADDRYRFLFDQLCKVLVQDSPFNRDMPQPFRWTARRYLEGDEATLAHMRDPENRNFMLSDLFDYIDLQNRMEQRQG